MTLYVVLDKADDGKWHDAFPASDQGIEARNAQDAITMYLNGQAPDEREGEFVAIPLRSWKPVTVKVETKTALKFS